MSYSTRDYIVSMTNFNSGHSMNVRIIADSVRRHIKWDIRVV